MVVADLLKPQWGPKLAFAAAFMPVGLMLFGALCLNETDGFARLCVAAGIPGASLLIPVNAYAVWNLIQIPGRADQGLISVGAVVGTLVAFAYIGQAREFLRRPNSE